MTLSSALRRVTYSGNDLTTIFPYEFLVLDEDDLIVSLYNSTTQITSILSSSLYSVTGIGDDAGGNVTYPLTGAPLAPVNTLTIERTVPYVQETDIQNEGGFFPEVVERQFDRHVMQVQQLRDALSDANDEIAALQSQLDSLPDVTLGTTVTYSSIAAAAASSIPTATQVLVARGDAAGAPLEKPALFTFYNGAGNPKIFFIETGGRKFAYLNSVVEFELCGGVEGDSAKDQAAWELYDAHASDYTESACFLPARVIEHTEPLSQSSPGNRAFIGKGKGITEIRATYGDDYGLRLGKPTARVASTDPSDRTDFTILKDVTVSCGVAAAASAFGVELVNTRKIVLYGVEIKGFGKCLKVGEEKLFSDAVGLINDVGQFHVEDYNFESLGAADPFVDHAVVLNSGATIAFGFGQLNGARVTGKRAFYASCLRGNIDSLIVTPGCLPEGWSGVLEVLNKGVANLNFRPGPCDSNREFFVRLAPSTGLVDGVIEAKCTDNTAVNGSSVSDGILIEPTGNQIERLRILGSFRKFARSAVRAVTGGWNNIIVDIITRDIGLQANDTHAIVDLDGGNDARVSVQCDRSGSFANKAKYIVQMGTVTRFTVASAEGSDWVTSRVKVAAGGLLDHQIVMDGSLDPAIAYHNSANQSNITGQTGPVDVTFDTRDTDTGRDPITTLGSLFDGTTFTSKLIADYHFSGFITLDDLVAATHTSYLLELVTTGTGSFGTMEIAKGEPRPDVNGEFIINFSVSNIRLPAAGTAKLRITVLGGGANVIDLKSRRLLVTMQKRRA